MKIFVVGDILDKYDSYARIPSMVKVLEEQGHKVTSKMVQVNVEAMMQERPHHLTKKKVQKAMSKSDIIVLVGGRASTTFIKRMITDAEHVQSANPAILVCFVDTNASNIFPPHSLQQIQHFSGIHSFLIHTKNRDDMDTDYTPVPRIVLNALPNDVYTLKDNIHVECTVQETVAIPSRGGGASVVIYISKNLGDKYAIDTEEFFKRWELKSEHI
ncbi:MAG: hypothetical protein GY941_20960 [Planctomycetes bacterium]|nr:hypothetical protein [Planctomycetota bacterium]